MVCNLCQKGPVQTNHKFIFQPTAKQWQLFNHFPALFLLCVQINFFPGKTAANITKPYRVCLTSLDTKSPQELADSRWNFLEKESRLVQEFAGASKWTIESISLIFVLWIEIYQVCCINQSELGRINFPTWDNLGVKFKIQVLLVASTNLWARSFSHLHERKVQVKKEATDKIKFTAFTFCIRQQNQVRGPAEKDSSSASSHVHRISSTG